MRRPTPEPDPRVMRFYDLAGRVVFVALLPSIVWKMWRRGKYRKGVRERFGSYDAAFRRRRDRLPGDPLWIQAVSVGETASALRFLEDVRRAYPGLPIALTTTTTTGQAEAARRAAPEDFVFYYPLDFRGAVRRALDVVRPRAMVMLESEIWPNMILECRRRGIPVAVVNARMSDRSAGGYGRWPRLFGPVFGSLDLVCAQSGEDAQRLESLGVDPERLHVVGNLKFDLTGDVGTDSAETEAVLRSAGAGADRTIWIAGSTHPGEEFVLGEIYGRLRRRHPGLYLVVVPRHVERTAEVVRDLRRTGLRPVLRTDLPPEGKVADADCLVVNTTGELRRFYPCADVVFVGKSLVGRGGQNIIEPAVCGRPIFFGPHMDNFRQVARIFLDAGAAVQVRDAAALERELDRCLSDPEAARALGERARGVVEKHRGACSRTLDLLRTRWDGILRG